MSEALKWSMIENMVTIIATAAVVLGLYAMGAGAYSGWGFLILFNLNSPKFKSTTSTQEGRDP